MFPPYRSFTITLFTILLIQQWSSCSRAFQVPQRPIKQLSNTALHVSIGLGPDEQTDLAPRKDVLKPGIDYEIPNHEEHRLDRLSKLDTACDEWFRNLLGKNMNNGALKGSVAEYAYNKLTMLPELKNDIELPFDDENWTPYVTTKLPWSIIHPAYGLEQFGLPTPRRNAETWRHFDVASMVNININGDNIATTRTQSDNLQKKLQKVGVWVNDDECSARLIYINGQFNTELSKTTKTAKNINNTDGLSDDIKQFLMRITDGFTNTLQCPVPMQQGEPLTEFSTLSGPDHCVGDPTSQFAINTQQGTACFTALNTIKCQDITLIQETEVVEKPVVIVHAYTVTGQESSLAIHPRTVIIAEENSHPNIVQQTITIDNNDNEESSRPILYNGYTQVWLKDNANITHTIIEESGGIPVADVEGNDDNIRAKESQRLAQKNTILDCLDVHVAGTDSYYTGTILNLGGCGRVRTASSISLLKPTSHCILNGFSLNGGTCRTDIKTNIHHIADGCTSNQLQKNMVAGRATSSFRGRIRVERSAQQTDSQQLSRTVLLSDKARAWSVPSLEIIADDVKCTHGATVSDLSEEELFYLRSRGLNVADARNLLMYAFCNDVLEYVPNVILGNIDRAAIKDDDDETNKKLQMRILQKLQNLVPKGPRAVQGEYSSI